MARNPLSDGCGQPSDAQARRQSFQLLMALFAGGGLGDSRNGEAPAKAALISTCQRWPLMAEVDQVLADQSRAEQAHGIPVGMTS